MGFGAIITEIIRETSYKLDDFYNKSFINGGITMEQTEALFIEIQKAKDVEFRFQASIHGVELKDDGEKSQTQSDSKKPVIPLFKDPETYKNMTDQEREDLTSNMVNDHRSWSGNRLKGK